MKVYIVVGTHISSCSIFSSISDYGVKSSLDSAKSELSIIKDEVLQQCEENETEIIKQEITDEYIKFVYDNDDEEIYEILERNIDKNEEVDE